MRRAGLILTGLLALAARAADDRAQSPDSISQAKKDLASLRAQTPGDPASSLPSLQMKDVGSVPNAPEVRLPALSEQEKADALDPSKKKRGTGNWLVDAMEKKADGAKDARGREKEDLLRVETDPLKPEDRDGVPPETPREKTEVKASVYNPLDTFMGGWISAKDRDLLLPASRPEGLAGPELPRGHGDPLPGLDLGASSSAVESLVAPVDLPGLSEGARGAPNPYLAALDLAQAPQLRVLAPMEALPPSGEPADFSRGLSSPGLSSRQSEAGRSFIPDFAQPPDDDKYFKQMKKF